MRFQHFQGYGLTSDNPHSRKCLACFAANESFGHQPLVPDRDLTTLGLSPESAEGVSDSNNAFLNRTIVFTSQPELGVRTVELARLGPPDDRTLPMANG